MTRSYLFDYRVDLFALYLLGVGYFEKESLKLSHDV
jgi:hypothetical protein